MQDTPSDEGDPLAQGLDGFMDNLFRELAPELDKFGENMSGALSGLAPVLQDLAVLGEDLANYQTPERLENGDILIRRKPGAPPPPPIGDDLRDFTSPDTQPDDSPKDKIPELIQRNPDLPEYEL